MRLFEKNWIVSRWVDFEYKKYTLLSYLQQVEARYGESKVYPYLTMLKDQLSDLQLLRSSLQSSGMTDVQKMLYGDTGEAESIPEEIENLLKITEFSLPRIAACLEDGIELEEFVRQSIEFQPVGLMPVDKREGYLIFRNGEYSRVYQYHLRRITPGTDNDIHSTQLKTWFIQDITVSRYRTLTDLKYELIKSQKELPNPAAFSVECHFTLPYPETLVPIGRKLLYDSIVVD